MEDWPVDLCWQHGTMRHPLRDENQAASIDEVLLIVHPQFDFAAQVHGIGRVAADKSQDLSTIMCVGPGGIGAANLPRGIPAARKIKGAFQNPVVQVEYPGFPVCSLERILLCVRIPQLCNKVLAVFCLSHFCLFLLLGNTPGNRAIFPPIEHVE